MTKCLRSQHFSAEMTIWPGIASQWPPADSVDVAEWLAVNERYGYQTGVADWFKTVRAGRAPVAAVYYLYVFAGNGAGTVHSSVGCPD